MPHPQHTFHRSLPIIQRVAPEADLDPRNRDEYVDKSLAILGDNMVTSSDFIKSQERQDKGISQEFKQQRIYMDRRFEKIDERFEKIDERFETLEERLDQRFERIDNRIEEMRARQLNAMCSRAHEPIHAIAKIVASDKLPYMVQLPRYFPKNVGQFWRLKSPGYEDKLLYLIKFYEIQGHEAWATSYDAYTTERSAHESSLTDDSSDPEDSTSSELALDDAVRRHPDNALRALAGYLGLVYGDMMRCMAGIEQYRLLRSLVRAKRSRGSRGSEHSCPPEKRAREVATYSPPRHSSSMMRRLYMTLSEELRADAEVSRRSSSERVRWHDPDIVEARAEVIAAMLATVPVSQARAVVQELEKLSRSERSGREHSAMEPSQVPTDPLTASPGQLLERRSSQASESRQRPSSKGSSQ